MALKATVFKAELQISDLDRHYYQSHTLTLARHPSETDERMMVRLLAFALYASEDLTFGRGLSAEDEADLLEVGPDGTLLTWIDVGLPDERDLRKASHRARRAVVLTYGGKAVDVWWQQNRAALAAYGNLAVLRLSAEQSAAVAALAARTMRLQCTVQEGVVWLGDEGRSVEIVVERLQG
ncbi:MAG: YaeQ family protein [Dechloromonas sp.]|jgi:uncharacterized protein YaeQ|nr:YaeQ family protein [Dechloromonas sp.]HNC98895.1 YaeQ family protein [Myxococcota bacterium]